MKYFLFALLLLVFQNQLHAQPQLVSDQSTVMKVPQIMTLDASATHLYILSESEGLAVFRTNSDTLQYLYTSDGMQNRGNKLVTDIRFAYQFGNGNRLTVIEPTSLLGVYSSTTLPGEPLSVVRISTALYVAMGSNGLGRLSLDSPAAFDTPPVSVEIPGPASSVTDLARSSNKMYALTNGNAIIEFDIDGDQVRYNRSIQLSENKTRIFSLSGKLYSSNQNGEVFSFDNEGGQVRLFTVNSSPDRIVEWNNQWFIRTTAGNVYLWQGSGTPVSVRSDQRAGNHITLVNNHLWMNSYDEVSKVNLMQQSQGSNRNSTGRISIASIDPVVVPFPRPVLIPLSVQGASPTDVRFQYRSEVDNAEIRGQGFFWQPRINQTGIHSFTITAVTADGRTDSTSFTVDVRSFNAPPRFNPVRPITILVDENYTLPIKATDPDGIDSDLIRYHGVDLPDGASISERTGIFSWTPDRRQVGMHQFRVIATDQYGAATSLSVEITVRNMNRD